MKWCPCFVLASCILAASATWAMAEFDFEAYRDYLARTRDLTAEGLLSAYEPFGPYEATVARRDAAPHYFEQIDAKLGLTEDELALLQQHDFVVSQRWRQESYGDAFDWVWHADLPVFISTDAILHAVHRSYDQILQKAENEYLVPELKAALDGMHSAWPTLQSRYLQEPQVQRCLADVDVYLTVARSLLNPWADPAPYTDSEEEVSRILELIELEDIAQIALFNSEPRDYDFSQFKLRGHYTSSEGWLQQYFRCMMWLGRTEFRFTHPNTRVDLSREITDAFLVAELVEISRTEGHWENIDRVLRGLVSAPDNLTVANLASISTALGSPTASSFLDLDTQESLMAELSSGPYAAQRILSQVLTFDFELDPARDALPFSFFLMGQRFIPDSFITGQVVYPFTPCADPETRLPPCRLMPDPLDALFALGNDDVLPFLESEVEAHEYAWNLGALRYLMDTGDDATWGQSLYTSWLGAIRTLSKTGRDDLAPQFMKTGAWQQQKMNTQLASWTELRHDNLLYAKPSYTGDLPTCSYPHSYVEPVPEFYAALASFAQKASHEFSSIPRMSEVEGFFGNMERTLGQLGAIATKELAGDPFTEDELGFLRSAVYETHYVPESGEPCSHGYTEHNGWYPQLIYATFESSRTHDEEDSGDAMEPDAIVADVHTDPNGPAVLHVATGDPELGVFIAALPGCDAIAYVGPVASYHQFVTSGFTRLNDEEWNQLYRYGNSPGRPDWTDVYLADARGGASSHGRVLVSEPPLYASEWTLPGPLGDPGDPDVPPDSTDTPPDDDPDAPSDSTDAPPDSTGTPGDDPDAPSDSTDAPSDSTDVPPDDDPGSPSDSTDTETDDDQEEDEEQGQSEELQHFFGVSPNPTRDLAIISFRLAHPVPGGAQISIFNSAGGRVRSFQVDGGTHLVHVRWDGNDSSGRKATAGVYYVSLEAGSETSTQKLVMIR